MLPTENQGVHAWRFAGADGTTRYQKTPQKVGERYTLPYRADEVNDWGGDPDNRRRICASSYGFHASIDPMDALDNGDGFFIERVRLGGEMDVTRDYIAASQRTTLWRADAKKTVLLFAASCAERALHRVSGDGEEIPGASWEAIEGVRKFAAGEMTKLQIQIVRAHARPPRAPYMGTADTKMRALASAFHAAYCCDHFDFAAKACMEAADAIGAVNEEVYRRELVWQMRSLHLLLMVLAPDGYTEPPQFSPSAPRLVRVCKRGHGWITFSGKKPKECLLDAACPTKPSFRYHPKPL